MARKGRLTLILPTAVVAAVVLGILIWYLAGSQGARALGGEIPATDGGARIVNGQVMRPAAIQAKIDSLNATAGQCLEAHGARRVDIQDGFYYDDPGDVGKKACAAELGQIDSYVDSPEVGAAGKASYQLYLRYSSCLVAVVGTVGTPSAADVSRCSTIANAG